MTEEEKKKLLAELIQKQLRKQFEKKLKEKVDKEDLVNWARKEK